MTVGELIAELSRYPSEMEVMWDGDDGDEPIVTVHEVGNPTGSHTPDKKHPEYEECVWFVELTWADYSIVRQRYEEAEANEGAQ